MSCHPSVSAAASTTGSYATRAGVGPKSIVVRLESCRGTCLLLLVAKHVAAAANRLFSTSNFLQLLCNFGFMGA